MLQRKTNDQTPNSSIFIVGQGKTRTRPDIFTYVAVDIKKKERFTLLQIFNLPQRSKRQAGRLVGSYKSP